MKAVQDAMATCGIPCYALAWRRTAANPTPPATYCVYNTRIYEDEHTDDDVKSCRAYVYLNMWTRKADPSADITAVRAAMRAGGFAMDDEATTYETETELIEVSWTWVLRCGTEVTP